MGSALAMILIALWLLEMPYEQVFSAHAGIRPAEFS